MSACGSCGKQRPSFLQGPIAGAQAVATDFCACPQSFHEVDEQTIGNTLVANLTCTVDGIRDIYTTLGARQYQLSLVWTRWSGGERGVGDEDVVHREVLLPTPAVSALDAMDREVQMIGTQEVGKLKVSELSPRYSEDLLTGRSIVVRDGDPVPLDMNFYWEVFFPQQHTPGIRRRFTPISAPNKNPTGFEWTIMLERAVNDRSRDGQPQ